MLGFFKDQQMYKSLARLNKNKKKRKKTQIIKIRNERRDSTASLTEIKKAL